MLNKSVTIILDTEVCSCISKNVWVGVLPGLKLSLRCSLEGILIDFKIKENSQGRSFFLTIKLPLLLWHGHIKPLKTNSDAFHHQAFVRDSTKNKTKKNHLSLDENIIFVNSKYILGHNGALKYHLFEAHGYARYRKALI